MEDSAWPLAPMSDPLTAYEAAYEAARAALRADPNATRDEVAASAQLAYDAAAEVDLHGDAYQAAGAAILDDADARFDAADNVLASLPDGEGSWTAWREHPREP